MRAPLARRVTPLLLALALAACAELLDPDGNRCLATNAVAPAAATLAVGATHAFEAAGYVEGAAPGECLGTVRGDFRWTSSAPAVASVDPASGLVTAHAVGTATIRARLDPYAGEAIVRVVPAP